MLTAARLTARRCAVVAARKYHGPPTRDIRFTLFDVHGAEAHYDTIETGTPCDRETADMVIDATATLCINELAPCNSGADKEGCTRIDGHTVKTPTGFKEAYDVFCESGWQGLAFPEKYGGQGLPMSLALVQSVGQPSAALRTTAFLLMTQAELPKHSAQRRSSRVAPLNEVAEDDQVLPFHAAQAGLDLNKPPSTDDASSSTRSDALSISSLEEMEA